MKKVAFELESMVYKYMNMEVWVMEGLSGKTTTTTHL